MSDTRFLSLAPSLLHLPSLLVPSPCPPSLSSCLVLHRTLTSTKQADFFGLIPGGFKPGPGVGVGPGGVVGGSAGLLPGPGLGSGAGLIPPTQGVGPGGGFLGGLAGGSPIFGGAAAFYNPNRVSDCPTQEYNRTGVCVTSAYECRNRGGRVVGQCFATPISGSNQGSNQLLDISSNDFGRRYPIGLCCIYQITCGGTVLQNGTFFRSPNSPATYNDARACTATIPRVPPGVCQVRLDFVSFSLKPPTEGECDVDKLIIDGQAQNNLVPGICGLNHGQHMYLDIDRSNNPITLTILTGVGSLFNRQFDIRITFIHCQSPFRSPPNCLQYHYDLNGEFKSFNFDYYTQSNARYLRSLDYAICFRKLPGFCSVTFSMPKYGAPVDQDVTQASNRPTGKYFSIVNRVAAGIGNGGSGPVKCPDDYLVIGTSRFCGTVLNDDVDRGSSPSASEEITDSGSGMCG